MKKLTAPQLALSSMVVGVVLALVKLIAGLIGHSYALVADSIESFSDIISSAFVLGGIRVSQKPASEKHPYGYGKAEPLAALAVAGIILAAGVGVCVQASHEILIPHHSPAPFTLLVLVVVVVVKELLFRLMMASDAALDGGVILAEAWHHRADAITSVAAFLGISIALLGGPGWESADDFAALIAGGIIIGNAVRLMRNPVRELLDVQADHIVLQARAVAISVSGVRQVQKVHARKSGPNYLVDMHVWVDPNLNIREAHTIGHNVKDSIKAAMPGVLDVLTHMEPDS